MENQPFLFPLFYFFFIFAYYFFGKTTTNLYAIMKTAKLYLFAFLAMFMLSFSSAWADIAYVKVIAEDGTVSWVKIKGDTDNTNIELRGTRDKWGGYYSAISIANSSIIDLNEVWSQSGGVGNHYQVTSIGDGAFSFCSGLTSIDIPSSVTYIGESAFQGCSGLTSIDIPSSVTYIGESAFQDCSGLTFIDIPSSVANIGNLAFSDCSSLTSVMIPSSVTNIGSEAFSGCSSLTSIMIPSSVTSIGNNAFSRCSSLKEVEINSNTVGSMWFKGLQSIQKVTLGEQVNRIESGAFYDCSGLKSITIPSSVTSIGGIAFMGCSALKEVVISDIAAWFNISFANYPANPLNCAHRLYLNGQLVTDLIIPENVTSVGDYAFYGCSGLTSVSIPSSVTSIGEDAFSGCSSLKEVEINTNTIGTWFKGLHSIQKITLGEQVTNIGNYAFQNCSGLTSINIPSNVTSIGSFAFSGCSKITEVKISDLVSWCNISFGNSTSNPLSFAHKLYFNEQIVNDLIIPTSVTCIGNYAFLGCSSLTSLTIPSNVTSIGSFSFSDCSGLTSITIPPSVASIGGSTFSGCSGLTSITIPSSVMSIGNEAFNGCTNLKDITSEITDVFVTGTDAFKGCENATLHVPAGTYVAYSGRADWNRIIHIEEAAEGSQMTLACNTKGSVLVNGKTTFTNKIKDVEVNEEEENTFEFIPNEGCRLEQVTLNGLDVTLSVSNNKLTTMIPTNSQMMVVFSKGNDINGDGNVNISDVVSLVNIILGQ